jgi:hypothetical protein
MDSRPLDLYLVLKGNVVAQCTPHSRACRSPVRPVILRAPWLMPPAGGDAASAAYLREEQAMLTVILIYTSGFLVVVASVLVAMNMTIARRRNEDMS